MIGWVASLRDAVILGGECLAEGRYIALPEWDGRDPGDRLAQVQECHIIRPSQWRDNKGITSRGELLLELCGEPYLVYSLIYTGGAG